MPTAPVIEANGARIPRLGLGTWQIQGEDGARIVAEALKAGYRHVDTAQAYENEAEVGEGLRNGGVSRDEVFVATKIAWRRIEPEDARRSMEESLGRLGLDQVDLVYIHWPHPEIDVATMAKSLCAVKKEGMARHIAVSNFPPGLLEDFLKAADEPVVANQCEYHPELDQGRVIEACRRHGLAFVSYSPLGKGDLINEPLVKEIAEAKGKNPGQVLLRWHLQQDGVVAIPKTSKPERARSNFDVFDFELSDEEMRRLHGLARPDGRKINPSWAPDWSR